jgi:ATP-dependent Clp protease ATP-binding subunit ClpA
VVDISRLGRDLSDLARSGSLDPVLGREREIRELQELLQQSGKRNILVIGEPGVGKSRLIEGLAILLHSSELPALQRLSIQEIEVNRLVAGTVYRGQFEERLEELLQAVRARPHLILFMDELHLVVGAGQTAESPQDAANTLKPALARGEITVIGATTPNEYERMAARDPAFVRRFHLVRLGEPSPEATLKIVEAAARRAVTESGVSFSQNALREVVRIAETAIPDRRQPDKSLDLLRRLIAEHRGRHIQTSRPAGHVNTRMLDILRGELCALRTRDYDAVSRLANEWLSLRGQSYRTEITESDVTALACAVRGEGAR